VRLLNVLDDEVKIGLTGRGISVLVMVQNRFPGLEELLNRLSWTDIAKARRHKQRRASLTFFFVTCPLES
jgi:hypothetical protein